jgi:trans-2-enoyl-CoA reductase
METLFFVLGIATVVIISTSVIAVVSILKVNKVKKELESVIPNIFSMIDDKIMTTERLIYDNSRDLNLKVDNLEKDLPTQIHSQVDSRLDKFEYRISNNKHLK